MKKALLSIVFGLSVSLVMADELDIAKEALRDGLWDVARNHALRSESDEAKLIILECYCREERWDDAKKKLDTWSVIETPQIIYYRALISYHLGLKKEASLLLESVKEFDANLLSVVARLKAQLALSEGEKEEALKILLSSGDVEKDLESRMMLADILSSLGQVEEAKKHWLAAVSSSNATEKIFVISSINIGDIPLLRQAYARTKDISLKRLAALNLGKALIENSNTFEEGASLIRAIAKDAPDASGASEAFVAIAEEHFKAKRYDEASSIYDQALEVWPALALQFNIQHGRGWSLKALGKSEEAMKAFVRAEEVATNDIDKAMAILEQGDVLSEIGRGEESLGKYRIVLEKYPKTPAGERLKIVVELRELESKGRELYKNFDFEGAKKLFALIAIKDPDQKARMEYYSILCLYGLGSDQEALTKARALAEATTDKTIRADVTLWLAKFSYNRRWWKEAARLFSEFVKMKPNSQEAPSAMVWCARAYFAENDFDRTIQMISTLSEKYATSPEKFRGYLVQGEALIELARFDEAVLVLDRTIASSDILPAERTRAKILRADALFAMGPDNPARYREALSAYQSIRRNDELSPSLKILIAFKISRTLEKLKRIDEAIDQYYSFVVLAYREGRIKGEHFDDMTKAVFARAAFRLADEYESRGKDFQAMHILELVVASDVPASDEAEKRIDRIQTKGKFL